MKIGITQLCVSGTVDEVVAKTKKWGYEVLELGMRSKGGILNLNTPAGEKKEIAGKITDAGINLVSIVALPVPEFSLFHGEGNVRKKGIDRCRVVLDTAALMGADTILLVPGTLVPETCYDKAVDLLINSLQKIAPHAERMGVNIGVENVWNRFLVSPLDMKAVIERVGNDFIGTYIDTGNMAFWNYPQHWIKILAPYIKKIHFKDFKMEGMTLKFTPLREGQVDWKAVMREIRNAGYDGPVISEVSGDDKLMAATARVMREIIK